MPTKAIVPQNQIPLFEDRPLPELIADQYDFKLNLLNHENGKRYYAVQDWIAGVAQTKQPARFWNELNRRAVKAGYPELFASCEKLSYTADNGKTYKMDFATAETLYQITERMSDESGIARQIKTYLAKAGVVVDDLRIEPKKPTVVFQSSGLKALKEIVQALEDQERVIIEIKRDVDDLKAKDNSPYVTIRGYLIRERLPVQPESELARLGRMAAKVSRENGYSIGDVANEAWGSVHTYHIDVLAYLISGKALPLEGDK